MEKSEENLLGSGQRLVSTDLSRDTKDNIVVHLKVELDSIEDTAHSGVIMMLSLVRPRGRRLAVAVGRNAHPTPCSPVTT